MKTIVGLLCLLPTLALAAGTAKVNVKLTPVGGDFTAVTTKVRGFIEKVDGGYVARDIGFSVGSLDSDQSTRNDHMWKELGGKEARVVLKDAKGAGGRGSGTLVVKGISKPISFSYTEKGDKVLAKFSLNFSHYGIKPSFMGVTIEETGMVEAEIEVR